MERDLKSHQEESNINEEEKLPDRRRFLASLGKWSMVVIGGVLGGRALLRPEREAGAAGWANRGGGGGGAWGNRAGGGGAAWANRAGGGGAWGNHAYGGGGAWANKAGGGGAWANRGAAWANRGGSWVNRF